jgi:hypothetical protein
MEYSALWAQTNGQTTLRMYRTGDSRYHIWRFEPYTPCEVVYVADSMESGKQWALKYLDTIPILES